MFKRKKKGSLIQNRRKEKSENHIPLLLVLVCGKILEKLMFSDRHVFYETYQVLSYQSDVKPGDSCIK